MSRKDVQISTRIPAPLKQLMQKYVERDTHLNESEFIRDAIRQKIERDAPDLYKEVFQTAEDENHE